MKYPPVQYHDYLQLNKVLDAQKMRSEEFGHPAHDEFLFITVHQAYELWFKQILFELNDVLKIFSQENVQEHQLATVDHRLSRVISILRLILGQIDVLETMTPLDFLEFRDYLYPASGFQSFQFRLLETKLGLKETDRLNYNEGPFWRHLKPDQQEQMQACLKEKSLFEHIEAWLSRVPFLQNEKFDFWSTYQSAVNEMLNSDLEVVNSNSRLTDQEKQINAKMIEGQKNTFTALFSDTSFETLREQNYFRMNLKAIQGALLIQLYRDKPLLQRPFNILSHLLDIDELMTQWRYRHALMAHRMLGKKIGTGGSSGHDYLKSSTEKHKIFQDLFNLTTFFIPRSRIPALPPELEAQLNFQFQNKT